MAIYSQKDRTAIDELCGRWREESLIGDASVLHPDEFPECWSQPTIQELHGRFVGNDQTGEGNFESKWELQLEGASTAVRLLAAECLLIYYLITESVGPARKRSMINITIGGEREDLHVPTDGPVHEALQNWIAHPGSYYNTAVNLHVGYLMDLALRLKSLPHDEIKALLHDNPWDFLQFAESGEQQNDTMQNVVCHLLYPRYFERMVSIGHKQQILDVFGELDTTDDEAHLDKKLYAIRQSLAKRLPDWNEERRDYYRRDLRPIWQPMPVPAEEAALDPASALEFKKQIVLYGPPGTGKTYQANRLAEGLVRTAAVQRWGVEAYFNDVAAVDAAVGDNVTRLQLHPGRGYPEFMIGLQLDADGGTSYQLGILPRLVEKMRTEREQKGDRALPHVLILDEINRTDLSAMFGEAFSLMERDKRGVEVVLAENADGEPIRFAMPEDLYIIGTMNEIDQSVEALDFALRRRFLWFPTPYSEEDLYAIWEAQWEHAGKIKWSDAEPQLRELAACITRLNERITELPGMGEEYELGAAVFGDLPYFIGHEWRSRRNGARSGKYLWNARGKPLAPLLSLWSLSINPVLTQYLAGSDRHREQVAELENLLTARPAS